MDAGRIGTYCVWDSLLSPHTTAPPPHRLMRQMQVVGNRKEGRRKESQTDRRKGAGRGRLFHVMGGSLYFSILSPIPFLSLPLETLRNRLTIRCIDYCISSDKKSRDSTKEDPTKRRSFHPFVYLLLLLCPHQLVTFKLINAPLHAVIS